MGKFDAILQKYNYNPSMYNSDGSSVTTSNPRLTGAARIKELESLPAAEEETAQQDDGILKSIIKDPVKTLLVKPLTKAGQAVKSLEQNINPLSNQNMLQQGYEQLDKNKAKELQGITDKNKIAEINQKYQQGYEYLRQKYGEVGTPGEKDTKVNLPVLGDINIEAQKSGAEGVKQIAGDALKSASYLAVPGGASATGQGVAKGAVMQAVKSGAKAGALSGGLYGAGDAVDQKDASAGSVFGGAAGGALLGGATGGILSGAIAGATGVVRKVLEKRLAGKALQEGFGTLPNEAAKIESVSGLSDDIITERITANEVNLQKLSPKQNALVKAAKTQGFDEKDIKFFVSMTPEDKVRAMEMIKLADNANSNVRVTQRPIDIAGSTLVDKLKLVQSTEQNAGKAVDMAAEALRGQSVDASPITGKANEILLKLGIKQGKNGLDYSHSVFKLTPDLQKTIDNFIQEIPEGNADAFDLHIFKKTIDELVNYGTQGEGLKGNASTLLKQLRRITDEVLDSNFADYNASNTEYKYARELNDMAKELFGKKIGTTGKGSEIRAGQVLRSAYSNNASRARVFDLAEQLDNFELSYTGKNKNNALDLALFAERLEKSGLYDTQALTGLSGQVENAIKKTVGVAKAIRNPIQGGLDLLATGVEKMQNISPEQKKRVLESLLTENGKTKAASKVGKFVKDVATEITRTPVGLQTQDSGYVTRLKNQSTKDTGSSYINRLNKLEAEKLLEMQNKKTSKAAKTTAKAIVGSTLGYGVSKTKKKDKNTSQ